MRGFVADSIAASYKQVDSLSRDAKAVQEGLALLPDLSQQESSQERPTDRRATPASPGASSA